MIIASSRPWSSAVPWCRQQEFGICQLSCCYIAGNTALPHIRNIFASCSRFRCQTGLILEQWCTRTGCPSGFCCLVRAERFRGMVVPRQMSGSSSCPWGIVYAVYWTLPSSMVRCTNLPPLASQHLRIVVITDLYLYGENQVPATASILVAAFRCFLFPPVGIITNEPIWKLGLLCLCPLFNTNAVAEGISRGLSSPYVVSGNGGNSTCCIRFFVFANEYGLHLQVV
ncbi:hypothetical protein K438DRAFT_1788886 [Mycena galopus ATCC 62051]|nr:hypothetical protein K438DRAFT_1788886 [Mycena galopus ATCC 62051]